MASAVQERAATNPETVIEALRPLQFILNLLLRASTEQGGGKLTTVEDYRVIADYLVYVSAHIRKALGPKRAKGGQ